MNHRHYAVLRIETVKNLTFPVVCLTYFAAAFTSTGLGLSKSAYVIF